MRVLLVAILIALLPLRSWAGDAMAIQMATQNTSPAHATAPEHADCVEHALLAADADDGAHTPHAPASSDGHCNTCASCQACSAVALTVAETAVTLPPLPHSVPRWTAAGFTSADRALGQKPPIS